MLLRQRCLCHTQQGSHPLSVARHTNQTVARISHTWWRRQHFAIWHQYHRWREHPQVFIPQHFRVWHNISTHQILSRNHGPSSNIHLVQSNRLWLLPRVARTHIQQSAPPRLRHNRNWDGPHRPTEASYNVHQGTHSQLHRLLHDICDTNFHQQQNPPCLHDHHRHGQKIYSDQTGSFPVTSDRGKFYVVLFMQLTATTSSNILSSHVIISNY